MALRFRNLLSVALCLTFGETLLVIVCVGCKVISWSLFGQAHCLCDDCLVELESLYEPCYMEWHTFEQKGSEALVAGIALYKYQGLMRDLIIQAKAGKCSFSLRTIMYLWRTSAEMADWLKSCHFAIPVNSSLAGRLRGGFDIAYHLAGSTELTLKRGPFSGRFRLRKQSFISSKLRKEDSAQFRLKTYSLDLMDDRDQAIYGVVDDIVTSGQSIFKMITDFNPPAYQQFKIAALAYACSQDKTSV